MREAEMNLIDTRFWRSAQQRAVSLTYPWGARRPKEDSITTLCVKSLRASGEARNSVEVSRLYVTRPWKTRAIDRELASDRHCRGGKGGGVPLALTSVQLHPLGHVYSPDPDILISHKPR